MATERQHQLDLIIDVKRPHWNIVQDILTIFKSAMLDSDGKYKIITDRDDIPVRQVFHAGNMISRAEVRIAKDPASINQLTAEYSNRNLAYERDIYILQDSAEIFGDNAPIKNADTSLLGITRPTEVARRLDFEMQRRKQTIREVTFETGLEAVAVEPGDHCIVGVLLTDFSLGYGGRVLEGSTTHFIADREVTLSSSVFDLWIWHTSADTPEQRTLSGSTQQIRIVPSVPFTYPANSGDRWAIGVQSQELILASVKRVVHNHDNGNIQIVADEYTPITVRQDCPNSSFATGFTYIPSQPTSVIADLEGCDICFQVSQVSCQGGLTRGLTSDTGWTMNGSGFAQIATVLDNSIHPPIEGVLMGNTLSFVSGANSGRHTIINCYTITGSADRPGTAMFNILPSPVASGTAYYVSFATSNVGFRVDVSTDGASMSPIATFFGNSGCVDLSGVGSFTWIQIVPITALGTFNMAGAWVYGAQTPGCFSIDDGPATSPVSLTTQSLTTLLATSIPGSTMLANQPLQLRVIGLVNDACDSGEATEVSFGLIYVNSTIIDSLVINLRNPIGTSVGTNSPFTLKATFSVLTVPTTSVRATLEYVGPFAGGTQVTTQLASSPMSINFTIPHSVSITIFQRHLDSGSSPHSHGCHSIVLDHAETEILGGL